MSNNKKHAPPKHPKLRGEWAELLFMARAAERGFQLARSLGDSYRWDVIVEHEYGFHRVQVKCTSERLGRGYICRNHSSKGHVYTAKEIDFLAVYVVPTETWYVIPMKDVTTNHVYLDPGRPHAKYAPYREAWHLLKQPGRFNINACAAGPGEGWVPWPTHICQERQMWGTELPALM